jgi:hypothetical protein
MLKDWRKSQKKTQSSYLMKKASEKARQEKTDGKKEKNEYIVRLFIC